MIKEYLTTDLFTDKEKEELRKLEAEIDEDLWRNQKLKKTLTLTVRFGGKVPSKRLMDELKKRYEEAEWIVEEGQYTLKFS